MFLPSTITLQFGDSGDFVAELQRRLSSIDCFNPDAVNGFFDGNTVNAVSAFQSRVGIRADGIAGPETLRRLNGAVAGDWGSATTNTSNNEEEQEKQLHSQTAQAQRMAEQQATYDAFGIQPAAPIEATPTPVASAEMTAPAYAPPPLDPQIIHQQAQQQSVQQQLNVADAPLPQPVIPIERPQPLPDPQPLATNQPTAAMLHQANVSAQQPESQPPQPEQVPAAKPNLVQRTLTAASEFMQKLSSYFEAKLPPSVLDEVKSIGLVMAQSGLKETPIPGGPELPTRGPDLPARAPDQAQQRS